MPTDMKTAETGISPHMYMGGSLSLPWMQRIEDHPSWPMLAQVPETVTVRVTLPAFTLRELLTMEQGSVFESNMPIAEMVPIRIGSVQIAWGEFEVVEKTLALRVAKLA